MAEQNIYKNIINSLSNLPLTDLDTTTIQVITDVNASRDLLGLKPFTTNSASVVYNITKSIIESMNIRYYPTVLLILTDILDQYTTTLYNGFPSCTAQSIKYNLELINEVDEATIVIISEGVFNPIIKLNTTETADIKLKIAEVIKTFSACGDVKFTQGAVTQDVNLIDGESATIKWDYLTTKDATLLIKFTRNLEEENLDDLQGLVIAEANTIITTFFSKIGVDILYQYFQGISKDILGVKNCEITITVGEDVYVNEDVVLAGNELLNFTSVSATEV